MQNKCHDHNLLIMNRNFQKRLRGKNALVSGADSSAYWKSWEKKWSDKMKWKENRESKLKPSFGAAQHWSFEMSTAMLVHSTWKVQSMMKGKRNKQRWLDGYPELVEMLLCLFHWPKDKIICCICLKKYWRLEITTTTSFLVITCNFNVLWPVRQHRVSLFYNAWVHKE